MSNNYYTPTGNPDPVARARSATQRTENTLIETAFTKLPAPRTDANEGFDEAIYLPNNASYGGPGNSLAATIDDSLAIAVTGSAPGDVPITSLGVGTAAALELIRINSGATVPEGISLDTLISAMSISRKNYLWNGDFKVASFGTSFTSATVKTNSDNTYLIPGWKNTTDGNDAYDINRLSNDAPTGSRYSYKMDLETASKKGGIVHWIEGADTPAIYQGATGVCSLSFWVKKAGTFTTKIKAVVLANTGTFNVPGDPISAWGAAGTDPTFVASVTSENSPSAVTLTTSWQKVTIENISLDTANTDNIGVFIWIDTPSDTVTDTVLIAQVQLESGATATDFEFVPLEESVSISYRYAYSLNTTNGSEFVAPGLATTTAKVGIGFKFPTTMIKTPSETFGGANLFTIYHGPNFYSADDVISIDTTYSNGKAMFTNSYTVSGTPFTVGEAVFLGAKSGSETIILFDAGI